MKKASAASSFRPSRRDSSRAATSRTFRPTRARREAAFLKTDQVRNNLPKIQALSANSERRGQSLSQMAIAWVLRLPTVTSALLGASSIAQLEENLQSPRSAGILNRRTRGDRIDPGSRGVKRCGPQISRISADHNTNVAFRGLPNLHSSAKSADPLDNFLIGLRQGFELSIRARMVPARSSSRSTSLHRPCMAVYGDEDDFH